MPLISFTIPYDTYDVGSANIVQTPIPMGATDLFILVDVTDWHEPSAVLDVFMEFSLDGGITWEPGGRAPLQSNPDGNFYNKDGTVATTAKSKFSWPDGVTDVKGTVTVLGAAVPFSATVDVN